MIDVTKTLEEAKEISETLKAHKDELLAEIKEGDTHLYPKYLEVCSDYLSIESSLKDFV